ncbi:unnamed protein product [Leuciscus chuanchicus]
MSAMRLSVCGAGPSLTHTFLIRWTKSRQTHKTSPLLVGVNIKNHKRPGVLKEPSGRPSIKAGGTGECEAVSGAALLINQTAFRLAAACLRHIATLLAHSAAPKHIA